MRFQSKTSRNQEALGLICQETAKSTGGIHFTLSAPKCAQPTRQVTVRNPFARKCTIDNPCKKYGYFLWERRLTTTNFVPTLQTLTHPNSSDARCTAEVQTCDQQKSNPMFPPPPLLASRRRARGLGTSNVPSVDDAHFQPNPPETVCDGPALASISGAHAYTAVAWYDFPCTTTPHPRHCRRFSLSL